MATGLLEAPPGFDVTARTDSNDLLRWKTAARSIFGVQFHPEVTHTENGDALLRRFLFDVCECQGDWTIGSFIENTIERIRKQIGNGRAHLRDQRRCRFDGGGNAGVAGDRRSTYRRVRQYRSASKERVRKSSVDASEQSASQRATVSMRRSDF